MTHGRMRGARLLGSPTQSTRSLRVRIQLLLTVLLVITNVIGAGIVLILRLWVLPGGRPNEAYALSLAIATPVYVGVAVVVGATVGTVACLRPLRWALQDRQPTEEERRTALTLSGRLTLIQVVLWSAAVVLFSVLSAVLQPATTLSAGLSVVIAGTVVCTIAYLISEYAFRPIAARALTDGPLENVDGTGLLRRMVVFWSLGTAVPILGIVATCVAAVTWQPMSLGRVVLVVLSLTGVILVFGLLVTVLDGRAVAGPVASLRDGVDRVRHGDYDVEVPVDDSTELGRLQAGFNQMAAGLRERERIRDLFGRHVGHDVAQVATAQRSTDDRPTGRGPADDSELGGTAATVSTLMVDLVGSTTYAARRDPTEVVEVLNRFFAVIVEEVTAQDGLVNKFMGDAVLAIFGAPRSLDDHAGSSLRAARAIARRLTEEVPEIRAGIGVSTGDVVAGNVGHESRFEYTVIGDAVNAAARLTDLAKGVPGGVLVTWRTVEEALGDEWREWQQEGEPTLRGREEPTVVGRLSDPPTGPPSGAGTGVRTTP
ncbi:adenylate/guanylate cyclase domain-containing protein [Aeromicrobium sp. CTD01-1L150]|uniref:adenylate/guanylate cyclase domain-containing protein n=1 Tax=Aeromicrobium sp. CTD01-1L150 TaxID=3341830 RepID=UPI0035C14DCE